MRVVSTMLALAVSLVIVGNLSADDTAPPKGKHHNHPKAEQWDAVQAEMLKGVNLTDDQKAKLEDLKKEYGPKVKEAWQKMDSILTDDQKKARQEAVKAAKAAGKKRDEVWKDAQAAVKLTDEQKAKMDEARKGVGALRKEIHQKVMALLTPEQQDQLKKSRDGKREHGATDGKHAEAPKDGKHAHAPMSKGGEMLKGINLTDDQKAKVEDLKKEYAPKIEAAETPVKALRKEVHEKILALLTPEQKAELKAKREEHKKDKKSECK